MSEALEQAKQAFPYLFSDGNFQVLSKYSNLQSSGNEVIEIILKD